MSEPLVDPPQPSSPPLSGTRRWLAGCGGALLALVCAGLYWAYLFRGGLPTVTAAELAAARARWEASRPAGYDLELRVVTSDTATYVTKVRGGVIASVQRNGHDVPQRSWDAWDVGGLFAVIDIDLTKCAGGPGEPAGNLVLRGEFDPQYGYPRKYQRIQLNPSSEVLVEAVGFREAK